MNRNIVKARKLLAEEGVESGGKTSLYYLSFSDGAFLGAVWIRAFGPRHAIVRTGQLGINPGGHVKIVRVPDNVPASALPPADYYDRLCDLETLKRILPGQEIVHMIDDVEVDND